MTGRRDGVEVRRLDTRRRARRFLTFPWRVYRNDPLWVPPILPDACRSIDPRTGIFFARGEAEFFMARVRGRPAGTICAAVDPEANRYRRRDDCLFGFFECVSDYAVAEALFDRAAAWAAAHGLESLLGPYNLDYENAYGVLVEGRDRPAAVFCGHSPPYYRVFMERYGFEPARGDNMAYEIELDPGGPALARLARLAGAAAARSGVRVRGARIEEWDAEVNRVHALLNRALAHLPDAVPWRRDVLELSLASFRAIADPDLVLFAEDGENCVGWFPGIPDMNEVAIRLNGLRYLWNYAALLRRRANRPKSLSIKSVLVLPEYWNTGVGALLFDEMAQRALVKGYRRVDLSLTSEDNPQTPLIAQHLGARLYKRYRVYRRTLRSTP